MKKNFSLLLLLLPLLLVVRISSGSDVTLLNVSYDPTRELFEQFNPVFEKYWEQRSGQKIVIRQSHSGSAKQARAVIDGLRADVVTLALAYDIDTISKRGKLLPADWQQELPNNSAPYTSAIVFLVRAGNPKQIRDWSDLIKPNVSVITPNPKTSGGARWNYLAAWAFASRELGGEDKAREFMVKLFRNVPVLSTGARAATSTFINRGIGDVLIAWENEAMLMIKESGPGKFERVAPSLSILAEPSVAVVEKVARRKGTSEVAKAYLQYLYSPEGQEIIAKNFYRPRSKEVFAKYESTFAKMELVTVDGFFGGWAKAHEKHFRFGGTFDEVLRINAQR